MGSRTLLIHISCRDFSNSITLQEEIYSLSVCLQLYFDASFYKNASSMVLTYLMNPFILRQLNDLLSTRS